MTDAGHVTNGPGTGDTQLVSGRVKLHGYSAHETATIATAASIVLRDGTSTSGKPVVFIELAADGDKNVSFVTPLRFSEGLFLDRTAGESEITVHIT